MENLINFDDEVTKRKSLGIAPLSARPKSPMLIPEKVNYDLLVFDNVDKPQTNIISLLPTRPKSPILLPVRLNRISTEELLQVNKLVLDREEADPSNPFDSAELSCWKSDDPFEIHDAPNSNTSDIKLIDGSQ
jgi:hypothetical protein